MKQLKNGFFRVTQQTENQLTLSVVTPAQSEAFVTTGYKDWDAVKEAILGTMRASGGKVAVVVDETKQNIAKEIIYYKINENGGLKQFVPTAEEAPVAGPHDADLED
jgi:hypothetical protein